MSRTRIKICGNTNIADLAHAISCGCDAVGFITDVPVKSPRKIDAKTAKHLIEQVPVFVEAVLVIMPEDLDSAMALIRETMPTCVQVHNDLLDCDLAVISDAARLIKTIAVPVDATPEVTDQIVSRIAELEGIADAILLDTSTSARSEGGGTGKVHDWRISAEIVERSSVPIILAGGLTPDNVSDAIRAVRPYAVDTASGVETAKRRDPAKVQRVIEQCVVADND